MELSFTKNHSRSTDILIGGIAVEGEGKREAHSMLNQTKSKSSLSFVSDFVQSLSV